MEKLFILIIYYTIFSIPPAAGEVEPPNYNFSLKSLNFFLPGASFDEMKKKYGTPELTIDDPQGKVYRFNVAQIRYVFPVFVRIINNKSVDFHARLPTYFSHDLFHQAIINAYGKQNTYLKKENSALYVWKNAKGAKLTYSATCTITCFPIFFSGVKLPLSEEITSITEALITNKVK